MFRLFYRLSLLYLALAYQQAFAIDSTTIDLSSLTIPQRRSIDGLSLRFQPLHILDLPTGKYEIDGTSFRRQNVSESGMRCFFNAMGLEADIEIAKL